MVKRILWVTLVCALINPALPVRGDAGAVGFHGTTLDGRDYIFRPDRLRNPVLAVFWASWCRECRYEFHELKKLHARTGDQLLILGVSVDRDVNKARRMARLAELPYVSVFDPNAEIAARFGVRATPTLILIDRSGVVRHTGHRLDSRFHRALDQILDAS